MSLTPRRTGLLALLLGALLFSTKAVMIKLAYRYDVSSISFLGLRMLFSLPFFLAVPFFTRNKRRHLSPLPLRPRLTIMLLGCFGYYLASYTDFLGLQYVSAGMERVILFTYPTMVLLLQRLIFKTPIRRVQWVATVLCYLGIGIAFSGSDWSAGSNFGLGAALVLLSAFLYSFYVIGSGKLAPEVGNVRFTSTALVTAAACVSVHVLVSGEPLLGFPDRVYLYAIITAIFCTVIPSYLVTAGIQRLGAGDAAIVGAIGPVGTIVLEYLVLQERMNVLQGAGAVLIIAGVVLIGRSKT